MSSVYCTTYKVVVKKQVRNEMQKYYQDSHKEETKKLETRD